MSKRGEQAGRFLHPHSKKYQYIIFTAYGTKFCGKRIYNASYSSVKCIFRSKVGLYSLNIFLSSNYSFDQNQMMDTDYDKCTEETLFVKVNSRLESDIRTSSDREEINAHTF